MLFPTQKSLGVLAAMALQTQSVLADCFGNNCWNPAGIDGCFKTSVGESICRSFYPDSASCLYCIRVNCGGYGSAKELADLAFCRAENWVLDGAIEKKRGVEEESGNVTSLIKFVLDSKSH